MAGHESTDIESILREGRKFEPPAEFSEKAHVKSVAEYEAIYQQAEKDPEGFWAEQARELAWFKTSCILEAVSLRNTNGVARRRGFDDFGDA